MSGRCWPSTRISSAKPTLITRIQSCRGVSIESPRALRLGASTLLDIGARLTLQLAKDSDQTIATIYEIAPVRSAMTSWQAIDAASDFDHDVSDQLEGFDPESSLLDAIFGAVVVESDDNHSPPSGMAVGTSQAELEAALGDQLEISPHKYVDDGSYNGFAPGDPTDRWLHPTSSNQLRNTS